MLGELPYRAEGLLRHAFAAGVEIFGFTTAFLRGLGFFSLHNLTVTSTLLSKFDFEAVWIPLGASAFAAAPIPFRPSTFRREGTQPGPMFGDRISRIGFSFARTSALAFG
jgi:hypothetical protein